MKKQGYLALADNNLTYPAIAMGADGKGAIAFTVVGEDLLPQRRLRHASTPPGMSDRSTSRPRASARPTASPATRPSSAIRPAPAGATTAPRSPTATSVWIASEYIAQTCTYAQYYPTPPSPANFGSLRRHPHVARQLGDPGVEAQSMTGR